MTSTSTSFFSSPPPPPPPFSSPPPSPSPFHHLQFPCTSFFITSSSTSLLFLFFFLLLLVKGVPREEVVYLELGGEASREISKPDPTWATKSSRGEYVSFQKGTGRKFALPGKFIISPLLQGTRDDGSLCIYLDADEEQQLSLRPTEIRLIRMESSAISP